MIMLDSNIVAVSLPSIARDLNATFADIEWVVSAYVLTFAALLDAVRGARGSVRAAAHADRRPRHLHSGVAAVRPCPFRARSERSASAAGRGRGDRAERGARRAGARVSRRGTRQGVWILGHAASASLSPSVRLSAELITSASAGAGRSSSIFRSARRSSGSRSTPSRNLAIPMRRDWTLPACCSFGGGLFCLIWALIGANRIGWSAEETRAKLLASAFLLALFVVAELDPEAADGGFRALSQAHVSRRGLRDARLRCRRSGHDDLSAALSCRTCLG